MVHFVDDRLARAMTVQKKGGAFTINVQALKFARWSLFEHRPLSIVKKSPKLSRYEMQNSATPRYTNVKNAKSCAAIVRFSNATLHLFEAQDDTQKQTLPRDSSQSLD